MSSPTEGSATGLNPEPPFTKTSLSDVILRSSNGVDFYVNRAVLSLVSSVFETMFSLPQTVGNSTIPVVDLQEDSELLDRALRFFYPGTQLLLQTLDDAVRIFQVLLRKYDMQCLVPAARNHLEAYITSSPVSVYAQALAYQWADIAKAAATESLKSPVLQVKASRALDLISGSEYHNLLWYHRRCGAAAKATTTKMRWITFNYETWFTCDMCRYHSTRTLADASTYPCRKWFMEFLLDMGDLLARTPKMGIRAHRLFTKAVAEALQCAHCRTHNPFEQLATFVSIWEKKILSEVAKVELKL
ncbi:hypothetical protein GGX14DRAFT_557967 [Mycena pura]|uniref:BTB domain-containing protein n=1 Tax=Mycena pura TaxID=153505 RepID=A0AAD7E1A5_9AGAR|nr:hypothetical protein GGX14DRAFT_557967 [Mycena pura]